jgi:hypothetical protein
MRPLDFRLPIDPDPRVIDIGLFAVLRVDLVDVLVSLGKPNEKEMEKNKDWQVQPDTPHPQHCDCDGDVNDRKAPLDASDRLNSHQ